MCILTCIDVKYNLHEMNYRIEHVLSFCAGYNVTIISLSFLVVPLVLMVSLVLMVPLVLTVLVVLMVPLVHICTSRATSMKLMSFEKYTSSILMEGPNQ